MYIQQCFYSRRASRRHFWERIPPKQHCFVEGFLGEITVDGVRFLTSTSSPRRHFATLSSWVFHFKSRENSHTKCFEIYIATFNKQPTNNRFLLKPSIAVDRGADRLIVRIIRILISFGNLSLGASVLPFKNLNVQQERIYFTEIPQSLNKLYYILQLNKINREIEDKITICNKIFKKSYFFLLIGNFYILKEILQIADSLYFTHSWSTDAVPVSKFILVIFPNFYSYLNNAFIIMEKCMKSG